MIVLYLWRTIMKMCRKCKIEKPKEGFYKRTVNNDGLYSYCKQCCREDCKKRYEDQKDSYLENMRIYREKNPEKIKETLKKYYLKTRDVQLKKRAEYREKNKQRISLREALKRKSDSDRFDKNNKKHLEWAKKNRDRLNEYQKSWYEKNKEKRKAHIILRRAIISGKIMRPCECSECLKICKPDGHHQDYAMPLQVVWLCRACHSRKSPRTVIK